MKYVVPAVTWKLPELTPSFGSVSIILFPAASSTCSFAAGPAVDGEILRMIKEEPPKPSTRLSDSGEALASISTQRHMEPAKLAKLVRGEPNWIVMKTLVLAPARLINLATR